jgi:3-deoxy-D-manno-octulosonate 8-phosphate phosphatase (KDO 8-P phosphatase)
MPCDPLDLARKAAAIRLLLFDVDGVLTDGRILIHADGAESKQFSIRDGTAVVWAQRAGLAVGLLSGRHSAATTVRAAQLGIAIVRQVAADKLQMLQELLGQERLQEHEVAFMGDDLLDLPVLLRAGLSAAPADAAPEVIARVDWVSGKAGGDGAARELVEMLLRAQGKWEALLQGYLPEGVR